jgi:hypothetical protein
MNTALPLHKKKSDVRLRSGLVQRISGTTYFVADACSLVQAERSAGCLLQPEQDDLVLITEDGMGKASILTVLEREAGKPAMVSVDGDLLLQGKGNLSFKGSRSLNLLTPKISLKADRSKMKINDVAITGQLLTACGRQLRSIYQTVEMEAKAVVERVNRLYRRVKDEDAQLGQLHCRVRAEYSIRAQDTSIDAENTMDLKSNNKIELG